jgi:hypothetical protein
MRTIPNGREHGWSLYSQDYLNQVSFSESRNSDKIVVYCGEIGQFDPGGNVPSQKIYANKTFFDYNDYIGAARFVVGFLTVESS